MSTTGQETADSEELRRKQNMAKARLNYYSHNLKLRLQYARLKVDHGWQRQTLSEVENLYFRHSRRPYPPVNPRKKTSSDSNQTIPYEHQPVASSSTTPPNLLSTPPLSSSDSFGGLTRSDTLQTIPDTSVTPTAQSSFQSTTASGSVDIPRIPIPPSLDSYMAATMSPPRPSHDASMECRAMSPPPCSSTLVRPPPPPHPQLHLADPNIDPSLVSFPATPLTHPPPPNPPLSMATPVGAGPPQPPPTSQPLTRVPTLPLPLSPAPSIPPTASSLPSIHRSTPSRPPQPSPHPKPTPQTRPAPPTSHRPLASSTPGGKKPYRPIQPAPMKPSPLTYDSFWSSHQSS
ncbi:hypothetical protein BXZ70DRAFT_961768, partial [Cristinia sonorae]